MSSVLERPGIAPRELLENPQGDDFELVNGELMERNTGWLSSRLGFLLGTWLNQHVLTNNLGWVNGADAAYQCFFRSLP